MLPTCDQTGRGVGKSQLSVPLCLPGVTYRSGRGGWGIAWQEKTLYI